MRNGKKRTGYRAALARLTDPIYRLKRSVRFQLASVWRQLNRQTTFVAITGSHGKSTATALLGAILGAAAPTVVRSGMNTTRYFSKTVLATLPWKHRYCVLEVSGYPRGMIDRAVQLIRPQVGIVTAVGGDHLRAFRSFEATAEEKSKLVRGLKPDGLAVLNGDDPLVAQMARDCACRTVTFGSSEAANLRLIEARSAWPERLTIEVAFRGERYTVKTRLVGTHWHVSVMAALVTALELGIPGEVCLKAIAAFEPVFNRMSVHEAANGARYVLDAKLSYFGMEQCLGFLRDANASRRTVVLGTLSDHPGRDRADYTKVARLALEVADRVVFAGKNAMAPRRLKAEFGERLMLFENASEAASFVKDGLIPGEIVYIKGPSNDALHRLFGFDAEGRRNSPGPARA